MFGYIYKTTDLSNGKIYVGKHKATCFTSKYYGSGLVIRRIIKYCKDNNLDICSRLSVEVIDTANSLEELNEKERYWIAQLNSRDYQIRYNLLAGGDGGDSFHTLSPEHQEILRQKYRERSAGENNPNFGNHKLAGKNHPGYGKPRSEEVKAKISATEKGKIISEEHRKAISDKNKRKVISEDTRQKISKALKGKIDHHGEKNPNFGKTTPQDVRDKISKSLLGHKQSLETKIKRRQTYVCPLCGFCSIKCHIKRHFKREHFEFFDQLLFDSETNTYKILDANSQNQLTAK